MKIEQILKNSIVMAGGDDHLVSFDFPRNVFIVWYEYDSGDYIKRYEETATKTNVAAAQNVLARYIEDVINPHNIEEF